MIKVGRKVGAVLLDEHVRYSTRSSSVVVNETSIYLEEDDTLGLLDNDTILWAERHDYTGHHLPHYLNYFMIHLVDGYLQTGGY